MCAGSSGIPNFIRVNINESSAIYWDWSIAPGLACRPWEFWFEQEKLQGFCWLCLLAGTPPLEDSYCHSVVFCAYLSCLWFPLILTEFQPAPVNLRLVTSLAVRRIAPALPCSSVFSCHWGSFAVGLSGESERLLFWKTTKLNFHLPGAPGAGEPARLFQSPVHGSRRWAAGILLLPSGHTGWGGGTLTRHSPRVLEPCLAGMETCKLAITTEM